MCSGSKARERAQHRVEHRVELVEFARAERRVTVAIGACATHTKAPEADYLDATVGWDIHDLQTTFYNHVEQDNGTVRYGRIVIEAGGKVSGDMQALDVPRANEEGDDEDGNADAEPLTLTNKT